MKPLNGDQSGVALMQVVIAGSLIMITGLLFMQFIRGADHRGLNLVRRNENLNFALNLSDYASDARQLQNATNVVDKVGAGPPILYP